MDERFLGHQASQRFGADLLNQQKGKVRSGDDDLSGKMPLSQRRAKLDGARSRQAARWVFIHTETMPDRRMPAHTPSCSQVYHVLPCAEMQKAAVCLNQ